MVCAHRSAFKLMAPAFMLMAHHLSTLPELARMASSHLKVRARRKS